MLALRSNCRSSLFGGQVRRAGSTAVPSDHYRRRARPMRIRGPCRLRHGLRRLQLACNLPPESISDHAVRPKGATMSKTSRHNRPDAASKSRNQEAAEPEGIPSTLDPRLDSEATEDI